MGVSIKAFTDAKRNQFTTTADLTQLSVKTCTSRTYYTMCVEDMLQQYNQQPEIYPIDKISMNTKPK